METHFPFVESSDVAARTAQLQSDLKVVIRDLEELLKTAAGQLNERTAAHLASIVERAKVLTRQLEGRASASLKRADGVIRAHPYQFLGAAFAAGALIGVLVNRR